MPRRCRSHNRAQIPAYEGPYQAGRDIDDRREERVWPPSNDAVKENEGFVASPAHPLINSSRYKKPNDEYHLKAFAEMHISEQNFARYGCVLDSDYFLDSEEVAEIGKPLGTRSKGGWNTLFPPYESKTVCETILHSGQHNSNFAYFGQECHKLSGHLNKQEATHKVGEAYCKKLETNDKDVEVITLDSDSD